MSQTYSAHATNVTQDIYACNTICNTGYNTIFNTQSVLAAHTLPIKTFAHKLRQITKSSEDVIAQYTLVHSVLCKSFGKERVDLNLTHEMESSKDFA